LVASDKFCWTRHSQLRLGWWRLPLRRRPPVGVALPSRTAASQTSDNLFFGAFMAMGLYVATLAAAILAGGVYARWFGWASAASALLVLAGDLLVLAADAAFLAVLLGFLLFMAVLIALGVTMWRQAAPATSAPAGWGAAAAGEGST
jgi:hypothetical protein